MGSGPREHVQKYLASWLTHRPPRTVRGLTAAGCRAATSSDMGPVRVQRLHVERRDSRVRYPLVFMTIALDSVQPKPSMKAG